MTKKLKILKRIMIITIIIVGIIGASVFMFMQQASFGKAPGAARMERIKLSPNFKDGQFQNLHPTPMMTYEGSYLTMMYDFIFVKKPRLRPTEELPSAKTDLLNLNPENDILVWFGHSSYFLQIDGKKMLVDPVLSGSASPVSFFGKSFEGTDAYTAEELPEIDYLFITHDHWDHLDYKTLQKLKPKIKHIICGLGTGEHLEYWGFDKNMISENDWNETINFGDGFEVNTTPARHFTGRGFARNKTLWMSFVLITPGKKIFIGGDGGYDTHFAEIGQKFGGFDLAILENGQYNQKWKYIHMMPEQCLQASKDLKAKRLFPVHSGKFALAEHPWDEPLSNIFALSKNADVSLVTPMIGEMVDLNDSTQSFSQWWEGIN